MEAKVELVNLKSGNTLKKYLLINNNGMQVEVVSIGGTLTKIIVPDDEGNFENILLEWKDINLYEDNPGCFGALVGRVAGRIYKGKVTIDDKVYHFPINNNGNTLHGGLNGFHKKEWEGHVVVEKDQVMLVLTYTSVDQEEGFPGNLDMKVSYILHNDNALTIRYEGVSDADTIVNMTNHAYFNLSGNAKRDILDQVVYMNSNKICKLDKDLIPDGTFLSVDDEKPFDFRVPKRIGQDINADNIYLQYGGGYDHGFLLNEGEKAVELFDPISKRYMTVTTTCPGVVMYTMNGADNSLEFASGEGAMPRFGVCFETQKSPIGYDEAFKEAIILHKGETYKEETIFKFGIK